MARENIWVCSKCGWETSQPLPLQGAWHRCPKTLRLETLRRKERVKAK